MTVMRPMMRPSKPGLQRIAYCVLRKGAFPTQYAIRITLLLLTILTISASSPTAFAQEVDTPPAYVEDVTNAGTTAAAVLQIGVGARAQAMGNAAVTGGADATVLAWNPAAAALLDGQVHVAFDHTRWMIDTQLDYVGMVFKLPGLGTLGLSVLNFQMVDDQPVRTIDQPGGTGETYSASDLALAATYAASLTDRFSAGVTARYVRETLWHETASAVAFDLGVTYRTQLPGLSLAASLANFGGDLRLDGRDLLRPYDDDPEHFSNDQLNAKLTTDAFSLPLTFRFGMAYAPVRTEWHRVTLAADWMHPSDNSEAVNLGVEYTFGGTFSLRGGTVALFEKDRTGGTTLGLGVQRRLLGGLGVSADYTYAHWGILDGTHRLTLAVSR